MAKIKILAVFIGLIIVIFFVFAFGLKEKVPPKEKILLYYYNQIKDREIDESVPCSPEAVLAVEREIEKTGDLIKNTVNLLLAGALTEKEKENGFSTEFPLEGFEILSADIKEGLLVLKFSDSLNKTSGGSCRVGLLWLQIEKTAKQFKGVKEVRFHPEWLFQP